MGDLIENSWNLPEVALASSSQELLRHPLPNLIHARSKEGEVDKKL